MRSVFIIILLTFQFCVSAQNWQSVGTKKFNFQVNVLYSDTATQTLFATGLFWNIDTAAAYGLAELNGTEWENAFADPTNNGQKRIVRFQDSIYLSRSPYLFRWNGASWDTVATAGGIQGLYNDGDSVLYMMGNFGAVNSIPASYIARYDGVTWSAIDTTVWSSGAACCAFRYQGQMYFGGGFFNSSNNIWRIARWDGSQWSDVGGGITGSLGAVFCMEEYNGELYAGGYMTLADGNPGNYIARWNGSTWSQVGGGIWNGQVFNMHVFNNDLWVVGQFDQAGGIPVAYIARYDGLDWCSVGVFDNAINAIEVHNGELYVGGGFWTVDGDSVNNVVKWIGGNFSDSCGHLNTEVGEIEQDLSVKVFPNPANDVATFQFANADGSRTIIIYDEVGREIWRRESSELSVEFPASEFSIGMYFYTIIDAELHLISNKFIIER